jgi:hypothetical protein
MSLLDQRVMIIIAIIVIYHLIMYSSSGLAWGLAKFRVTSCISNKADSLTGEDELADPQFLADLKR